MSVFDLEKLAEFVISRMGPLLVDHKHCARARSPLSKCSRCKDICPRDCITFGEEGVEIADACLECGLCASVCPTNALQIQEPTELALLDKIDTMGQQGSTIAIGCRRQPELNPKGLAVPCLGSLSLEFLLVLEQSPYPIYLVLNEEECARCPVTGGGAHCQNQLAQVQQLMQILELKRGAIRLAAEAPPMKVVKRKQNSDPSRRAFFRSVFAGAKQMPAAVIQSFLEQPANDANTIQAVAGTEVSRQKLLKKGLRERKDDLRELDLIKRPILQSTCHFCRACTILCPLGAIKCSDDYQLTLDTGQCTGCGLCTEICLHHSLNLVPGKIAHIYLDQPVLLAQGTKGRCDLCGQEMISSEEQKRCFVCEKRAAMFAAN